MAFAKNFVWGAASSAYQTEGSPRADGGGESIWDVFCRRPGAVADGFDGSAATDAYRRYEEDIACAAQMGLGAYRFSVSWARVDPYGDGRWNGEGFAFYLRMLQACRAAGLEPYVTLYHWELPQALEDRYKLEALPENPGGYALLEAAGRKRGFLLARGEIDTERMARVLLEEFRSCKLGRFTFEMPEESL